MGYWLTLTCALLSACAPFEPPRGDAGAPLDGEVAAPDAGERIDALVPVLDGGSAAERDGGQPWACTCTPSSPCVEAFCEDGECIELPLGDGVLCGEGSDHVCVDGACVARFGCGDGYREPGPAPEREACDDGNASSGDACSAACEPTVVEVPSEGAALAPQIAIDRRGRALLVWTDPGAPTRVLGLRFDRGGRRVDEAPFVIAAPGLATEVAVSGARFGWLVAYTDAGPDQSDIFLRHVSEEAAVSPPRRANVVTDARQDAPRLAAIGPTVVLVWRDESTALGGPGAGIVARRFDVHGAPLGPELAVSDPLGDEAPALAAHGDGFLVAWTRAAERPAVMARAFDIHGAPRSSAVRLGEGFEPAVAGGEGGYAVAWTTRTADTRGDIALAVTDEWGALLEAGRPVAESASPEAHGAPAWTPLGPLLLHARGEGVVGRLRDLVLATSGFALPAESTALVDALATPSTQSAGTLARAHDGHWVLWNDDRSGRVGIHAFRLAIDGRTP